MLSYRMLLTKFLGSTDLSVGVNPVHCEQSGPHWVQDIGIHRIFPKKKRLTSSM